MRDPHVVALLYQLKTDPSLIFDNPPPLEHDTNQFTLRLADGVLTCTLKVHYTAAEEARAVVDPFLRAWELAFALQQGRREMHFVYQKAQVIDRDPPPLGSTQVIRALAIESAMAVDHPTVRLTSPTYPSPPKHFRVSPDVETLWQRYDGYTQNREPLLSMAYFCLSVLKWRGSELPGRGGALRKIEAGYGIAEDVLKRLGNLTTNLGDESTARKFYRQSMRRPPTPQEAAWIDAAIRRIIRRVGEHAAAPTASLPKLSMTDLPPL